MSETRLSTRYATALMEHASAAGNQQKIADDMLVFLSVLKESKDLKNALSNPIVNANQKLASLEKIFSGFNAGTLDFFKLACNRHRESHLPAMAEAYLNLYRESEGIVKVNVQTAVALQDKEKEQIQAFVMKASGARSVELDTTIDPGIIGGFVMRFGDRLLDTSIAAKLRKLKKELNIA